MSYLLSHRVGLTSFEPESGVGPRELLDWDKCTAALAAMTPLWEPGTAYMYHAVTYGYLVGEADPARHRARRRDGSSPTRSQAPLGLRTVDRVAARARSTASRRISATRPAMTLEQWKPLLAGFGIDVESRVAQAMMHMLVGTDEAIQMINTREGHAARDPGGQHDRQCGVAGADVCGDDRRRRRRAAAEARDGGPGARRRRPTG